MGKMSYLSLLLLAPLASCDPIPAPEAEPHFLANGSWAHSDIAPSYFSGRTPTVEENQARTRDPYTPLALAPHLAQAYLPQYLPQQQRYLPQQQQYLPQQQLYLPQQQQYLPQQQIQYLPQQQYLTQQNQQQQYLPQQQQQQYLPQQQQQYLPQQYPQQQYLQHAQYSPQDIQVLDRQLYPAGRTLSYEQGVYGTLAQPLLPTLAHSYGLYPGQTLATQARTQPAYNLPASYPTTSRLLPTTTNICTNRLGTQVPCYA